MNWYKIKIVTPIVLGAFILICLISSYTQIDAGHRGVVKRFGAVTKTVYKPGLHWKTPFIDTVDVIDVRLASIKSESSAGSKDQQIVKTAIAIQYYLVGSFTPQLVDSLGSRSDLESELLGSAIQESVKAVTALYTAAELLTKRSEVKIAVSDAVVSYISRALKEKQLDGLTRVTNVAIEDIDFSDEFNRAIEAKVKAQQEAEQAKADKEKKITQAEADNEKKKLEAEAEAYKVLKEAEARASAINQEGQALRDNPTIVQLRLAERWNGILPMYNGGGAVPFLNLDTNKFSQTPNTK